MLDLVDQNLIMLSDDLLIIERASEFSKSPEQVRIDLNQMLAIVSDTTHKTPFKKLLTVACPFDYTPVMLRFKNLDLIVGVNDEEKSKLRAILNKNHPTARFSDWIPTILRIESKISLACFIFVSAFLASITLNAYYKNTNQLDDSLIKSAGIFVADLLMITEHPTTMSLVKWGGILWICFMILYRFLYRRYLRS